MNTKKLKNYILLLISIILSLYIIKYLKIINIIKSIIKMLIPLFIGFSYAWLFNPLINKLSKNKKRNIISILLFLTIIIIIITLLYFLIPIIYREIKEVIEVLPLIFNNIENKINNMGLNEYLDKILSFLLNKTPDYILNTIKKTFSYLGTLSIGLILGLYISIDYPNILNNITSLLPEKIKCYYNTITIEVSKEIRKCLNGTLLIAFFVFISDSILFYLIKLDAPLIFGSICGITDLIPYIGPYIGSLIAILVGFTKNKITGILTIVICIIIQSIENYILQPIIMSKTLELSPIFIITGLLIFGNIFGIIGMILATPLVATIKVLTENILLAKKKC